MGVGVGLLISGLLGSIGSLISSGMQMDYNSKEAEKSRAFSEKENALNRQFQAEQAEINRQWQTDMSNTAYQRSVADMEKAGLNPNLMSGGLQAQVGSVSTPQGSSSSSAQASSSFGNVFSGLSSALNAYATIKNQEMIAKMYNDTYRQNNILNNDTKRLGFDINTINFDRSVWKYRNYNSSARR